MAVTTQQPYNLFSQRPQAPAGQVDIQPVEPVRVQQMAPATMSQDTGRGVAQSRPLPVIRSMADLASAVSYTTPQEEERLRKSSVANQRIMAVADALRHIGNIANTVNYAPSQQFNNPIAEEQARYERGKAVRDKANQTYITYQQQRALQDAKARQWDAEMQYKNAMLDHYKTQDERLRNQQQLNAEKFDWKKQYDQRILEIRKMHEDGIISKAQADNAIKWYNAQTSRMRAENGGAGGSNMPNYTVTSETTYTTDNLGRKTGSKTTKTRTVEGRGTTKSETTKTKKANPMGDNKKTSGKKKNPMS